MRQGPTPWDGRGMEENRLLLKISFEFGFEALDGDVEGRDVAVVDEQDGGDPLQTVVGSDGVGRHAYAVDLGVPGQEVAELEPSELLLAQVVDPGVFVLVETYADKLYAEGAVVGVELLEGRHLAATVAAPRCPEVDDDEAVGKVAEAVLRAEGVGSGEVGGGSSEGE